MEYGKANPDRANVRLSVKISVVLSLMYAITIIFLLFLKRNELNIFLFALILGSPLIAIVIIYPSVILGHLTGRLIVNFSKFDYFRNIPRNVFSVLCALICALIVLLIHIIFQLKVDFSLSLSTNILQNYMWIIGIPSIGYIIAGGWFGWKIYPTNKDR